MIMILTCPECATRFSIDSESIGPNGRTVRCSQCAATWFASADPDILSLNEIQNTPAIEDVLEDVDHEATEIADFSDDESPEGTVESIKTPHAEIRDKAERKKVRRRLFGVGMIWLTTLGVLAVAATMAILFRAQFVDKFPGTQALYSAVGIEASKTGLMIQNIRAEYGDVDGTPVLFINGEIKNFDRQARDVPLVQINFKNDNSETVASWVIEPSKSLLAKGELQKFASQYPNPPVDATKLVPVFVDETAETAPSIPSQ